MASPFPGMDPYLEQHWGDVHHSVITYARDRLNELLPNDLKARVEERVLVESPEEMVQPIIPDLRIFERPRRKRKPGAAAAGTALAEPLILLTGVETIQGFIEIRDASSGHRVVTVIEVLSPANKLPGDGQEQYLKKRQELRAGKVSLVEIDLTRTGRRPLPFSRGRLPPSFRTPYLVWVRRGWEVMKVEVYRVSLRERLPFIRIPLRPTDTDVLLDLQVLIDECYRNGDYEGDIDYQAEPDPPLDRDDARWADALLRKAGRRVPRRSRRPNRRNSRRKT